MDKLVSLYLAPQSQVLRQFDCDKLLSMTQLRRLAFGWDTKLASHVIRGLPRCLPHLEHLAIKGYQRHHGHEREKAEIFFSSIGKLTRLTSLTLE